MGFQQLFDFLERLQQNNNKQWMDANRKKYVLVRDFLITWLEQMNVKLAQIDDEYFDTPGKKAINRINNNLMFHPNKPIYKDHFSAGLDQKSKQGDFYMEFGVNACFVGGGYWHPGSAELRSIRDAIDYNGVELKRIIANKRFKSYFGELVDGGSLKTAPKGFDKNHEHIELLRNKSFAALHSFDQKETLSPNFDKKIIDIYKVLLPFRRYLNEAVTV